MRQLNDSLGPPERFQGHMPGGVRERPAVSRLRRVGRAIMMTAGVGP